jgi:hypothetical protein
MQKFTFRLKLRIFEENVKSFHEAENWGLLLNIRATIAGADPWHESRNVQIHHKIPDSVDVVLFTT